LPQRNSDSNTDVYSNSNGDSNCHGDSYSNSNAYSNCHGDSYSDSNSHGDCYSNSNAPAENDPNAKAASIGVAACGLLLLRQF
jgi:hypothetical protein